MKNVKKFFVVVSCFIFSIFLTNCSSDSGGNGENPPTPTVAKIGVIDSVQPVDDLQMPFGSVTQGYASDRTIAVVNYGTANLTIGTIAGTDGLAAPFSKQGDACSGRTLGPAENCAITIRFAPSGTGGSNDTFDIPSSDPNTPSITMAVSGTGVAGNVQDISVTDSAGLNNDLSIPFGNVPVGNTVNQTVTIANTGTASLKLGAIADLNPLAAPFSITADGCSSQTLAPSANCTLTIRFTAASTRNFSDSFEIPSNDPDTFLITFSVSGKGMPQAPPSTAELKTNGDNTSAFHQNYAVAFNAAGKGLAVWEENSGTGTRLLYSYFNGSTWSADAVLNNYGNVPQVTTDGTDFMIVYHSCSVYALPCSSAGVLGSQVQISTGCGDQPRIASGGGGKYGAVWYQYASGYQNIYANIYSAGTWTTAALLETNTGDAYEPAIASNGSGGYAAAWQQYDGSYNSIYANVYSAGSWTTATAIESGSGYAYNSQIASNGSGYAVAWQQYDGSGYSGVVSINANVYSSGTWTNAQTIETGSYDAYYPKIASNGAGYAVSWYQYDGSVYSIYANIYSAGAWTTATTIESGSGYAYNPTIASNGSGYAVAWRQQDGSYYSIYANIYSAGAWGTAAGIETGTGNPDPPVIAKNGTGYTALWQQPDSSGNSFLYTNTYAGSAWGTAAQLNTLRRGSSIQPRMAVNQYGHALAVWLQFHGGRWKVYGNVNTAGTWGAPFLISSGSYAYYYDVATNGPDFMIVYSQDSTIYARPYSAASGLGAAASIGVSSGSGNVRIASNGAGYTAAWEGYDNSTGYQRVYANTHNGASWGTAAPISPGTNYAYQPQIASDGSGYAVSWYQYDGSYYSIYANIYSAGTWTTAAAIETNTGDAYNSQIASNGSGYAVAWQQYDGSYNSIYANIYSAGTWTTAQTIETGSYDAYSPKIASNGSSYMVAWYQYDSSWNSGIYANIYSSGTWTTETVVEPGTSGGAYEPQIASDGSNYAVVWYQQDGLYSNIYYASKYSGVPWTARSLLETGDGSAQEPFIASNGAGYGAVWSQYDTTDPIVTNIWAKLGI